MPQYPGAIYKHGQSKNVTLGYGLLSNPVIFFPPTISRGNLQTRSKQKCNSLLVPSVQKFCSYTRYMADAN